MKIMLLQTGKTQPGAIEEGIREYKKRIQRYHPFEIRTLQEGKNDRFRPVEKQKQAEGRMILEACREGDYKILLDEQGKEFNSRGFAQFMEQKLMMSHKRLVFIIGGPWGCSKEVKQQAEITLSLSRFTFSHQLVRLVFMEQLYRCFTIMRSEPYHHD